MGYGEVVEGLILLQLLFDVLVRVDGAGIRHSQNLTRGGIQNDCLGALCLRISLGLFQLLLNVGLQIQIERQRDVFAVGRWHLIA